MKNKVIQYDNELANELFEAAKKYIKINKSKETGKCSVYVQAPHFINALVSLEDNSFGFNEEADNCNLTSDAFIRLCWDEHEDDAKRVQESLIDLLSDIIQYEIKIREEDKK